MHELFDLTGKVAIVTARRAAWAVHGQRPGAGWRGRGGQWPFGRSVCGDAAEIAAITGREMLPLACDVVTGTRSGVRRPGV